MSCSNGILVNRLQFKSSADVSGVHCAGPVGMKDGSGTALVNVGTLGSQINSRSGLMWGNCGWVGMKFTTPSGGLTISQLGRYNVAGSAGTYDIRIFDAATNGDVAKAIVNLAGQPAGWVYASLTGGNVTLLGSHTYYLMTSTVDGLRSLVDYWYDGTTSVTVSSGITVNESEWGTWNAGSLFSVDSTFAGFAQQYGYWEARVKMPASGLGSWPSFCLYTTNQTGSTSEEVDIFEDYGNNYDANSDGGALMRNHNWGTGPTEGSANIDPMASKTWLNYHIYAFQADPKTCTFYLDGVPKAQFATPTDYLVAPMYITLEHNIGGGWALTGLVANSEMDVDRVRVWSLPTVAPVITSPLTASATLNSAFNYQITANNGATGYNATNLPAGLSVNTLTGLISGTPSASGTFNVGLSTTNATGTGPATLVLTVNGGGGGTKIEAESGTLAGSAGVYADSYASGGYGVGWINSSGAAVTFNNCPAGSSLTVGYACPATGQLGLYINGTLNQNISFPTTGYWNDAPGAYAQKTVGVSIPSGATVKLQYDTGDTPVNVDYIIIGGGGGAAGKTIDINFSGSVHIVTGSGAYTGDGVGSPTWNNVTANTSTLYNSDGSAATGVGVSFTQDGTYAATTTPDLLSNFLLALSSNTRTVTISGLSANGNYQLYLYGQNGAYNSRGATFSISTGSGSPAAGSNASTANASNGNAFVENVNYVVFNVTANGSGTVAINWTQPPSGGGEGDFNGLQIVTSGSGGSGSLAGSVTTSSSSVNLTAVGTTDWAHWYGYDHKTTGGSAISDYTAVGSGGVYNYGNDLRAIGWSDGTPTASSTNNNGIYTPGNNDGFSIAAPADTTVRTLNVYVGGYKSGGKLTAHLSDGSASDYVDTTPQNAAGQYNGNYTLTYKAANAGAHLTVTWVQNSDGGGGNVTLAGAALSGGGAFADQDIGTPGLAGSASYAAGVYTVKGGGADIWGTSDQFNFDSQQVSGNCTITARVTALGNTDPWAKAGVMIRETLNANASNALMLVSSGNGLGLSYRSSTGAGSVWTASGAGAVPYWVKLVRSGSTFTAYQSTDGVNWGTAVGTTTISMATNVYVGLADTAHNNSLLTTATFDNVSVTTP
jgi:hypothetical protein